MVERLCRLAFSFSFNSQSVVGPIDIAYEVPHKLHLLPAVAAGLVRGMDDNLLYEQKNALQDFMVLQGIDNMYV